MTKKEEIKEEIIARAFAVFGDLPRPAHFTDHTHCCECKDHDEALSATTPSTIRRSDLGTMAWDPITFTTVEGFRYFLPGLIRVVLSETGDNNYYEQFLWHVGSPYADSDRFSHFDQKERSVMASCLHYLLDHRSEEIERECQGAELLAALEIWSAPSC